MKDPALSVLSLRTVWLFQYLSVLYYVISTMSRKKEVQKNKLLSVSTGNMHLLEKSVCVE